MEITLKYEYLIRMAYNCKRYGVPGADATTYDNYHGERNSFEDGLRVGKIITSIRFAADNALKIYKFKFSNELVNELEELADAGLIDTDKNNIDSVILRLFDIFQQAGLQVLN